MDQVLQYDRTAAHLRRGAQHLLGPRTAQGERGERLVDALGPADRVRLVADDQGVDDLGDLQEVDVPGERDERQPAGTAGPDQRLGRPVIAAHQLDDEGGGTDGRKLVDVAADTGRVVGQGHAGGEDEFAALQEGGGVRQLGDVDPADRTVEMVLAGHHPRISTGQDRQGQHVGHGGRPARRARLPVLAHGASLCTQVTPNA
ncbi:hypothetical protein RKD29_000822 [Streptomyces tendae]